MSEIATTHRYIVREVAKLSGSRFIPVCTRFSLHFELPWAVRIGWYEDDLLEIEAETSADLINGWNDWGRGQVVKAIEEGALRE